MADMLAVKQKFEKIVANKDLFDLSPKPCILNPILAQDDINLFQKRFSIELPEDYVFYLTKIANGGLGPSLNMAALDLNGVKDPQFIDGELIDLSIPFPFESDWNDERVLRDQKDVSEEVEYKYWSSKKISGCIPIGDFGGGEIALLIVNGSRRGDIWRDDRRRYNGIYPLIDGVQTCFSDWLDMWLDDVLNGFGPYQRRGD